MLPHFGDLNRVHKFHIFAPPDKNKVGRRPERETLVRSLRP